MQHGSATDVVVPEARQRGRGPVRDWERLIQTACELAHTPPKQAQVTPILTMQPFKSVLAERIGSLGARFEWNPSRPFYVLVFNRRHTITW